MHSDGANGHTTNLDLLSWICFHLYYLVSSVLSAHIARTNPLIRLGHLKLTQALITMMPMIRFHPEKLALILAVVGCLCIAQVAVLYKTTNTDAFY
jgi:hypothetical protein